MHNANYVTSTLRAEGFTSPNLDSAEEMLGRPMISPDFADDSTRLQHELAAELASDDPPSDDEFVARLAVITARRDTMLDAVVRHARDLREHRALDLLRDDKPIAKQLRGKIEDAVRQVAQASAVLRREGVLTSAEAMQLGTTTATAWIARDGAQRELQRLGQLREQLVGAGVVADRGNMVTEAWTRVRAALTPGPVEPAPAKPARAAYVT